jgi:hypothetical protein
VSAGEASAKNVGTTEIYLGGSGVEAGGGRERMVPVLGRAKEELIPRAGRGCRGGEPRTPPAARCSCARGG